MPAGFGMSEPQIIDLLCDNEEDAETKEAVLEFLYNHELPGAATVTKLCKMITAACFLGADLCIKASAISLSKLQLDQESIPQVCSILNRIPTSAPTELGLLHNALLKYLLDVYDDSVDIITCGQLDSFCKLPLTCIELWGKSDQVEIDSENTMVVLLNNWWHSQAKDVQTAECKKKLSHLVRPALLSSSYLHHVLDKLDWFTAPAHYKHACAVVNKYGVNKVDKTANPYHKLNMTKRKSSVEKKLTLTWRLPYNSIQQIVSSSTDRLLQGPEGYWQGHSWRLFFQVDASSKGDEYIQLGVGIKKLAAKSMPEDIQASADVHIVGSPFDATWKQMLLNHSSCEDFKRQELDSEVKQYLNGKNQLVITVKVSNVE